MCEVFCTNSCYNLIVEENQPPNSERQRGNLDPRTQIVCTLSIMTVLVGKVVYNQDLFRGGMFCLVGSKVLWRRKSLHQSSHFFSTALLIPHCLRGVCSACCFPPDVRFSKNVLATFVWSDPSQGQLTSEMEDDKHDVLIMVLPTSRRWLCSRPNECPLCISRASVCIKRAINASMCARI